MSTYPKALVYRTLSHNQLISIIDFNSCTFATQFFYINTINDGQQNAWNG